MTIKMIAILFCVPEAGFVLAVVASPPMSKLVDSYTQSALTSFTVELESDSFLPVSRHRPSTRELASPFAAGHFYAVVTGHMPQLHILTTPSRFCHAIWWSASPAQSFWRFVH